MKKVIFLTSLFLLFSSTLVNAFDLATQISSVDGKVILSAARYAKLDLIRIETRAMGSIHLDGTVSVKGNANIVMWVKVDDNYYFSKLPTLQNIHDRKYVEFQTPFNAAEKTITEVLLEVELIGGGSVEVENIKLSKGK